MKKLTLYNSLTKQLEEFVPKEPGKAQLYHCGPTVYKRQHLGNMRRFLFADFLRRTLEFLGYEVREITNITDVGHLTQDDIDAGEDKVTRAARAAKRTPADIAAEQTQHFMADIQALNIQPSHKYPRATDHITEMQRLITTLIDKGHAYATPTGVYFDVTSFPDYGKLSGNTLAKIEAGKRIAIREEKKHPADFALWVGDPQSLQHWDSPWGVGYPGWHIECSAMSLAYLDPPIDIHTGGEDNRFPHHENEIAQSEAYTGQPFVRYWLHNRHLQLDGQKLAKREGEQLTLDTVREHGFSPLAFRLWVFSAHYRKPMDFSWETLAGAQEHLTALKLLLQRLLEVTDEAAAQTSPPDRTMVDAFRDALADDLNTPQAFTVLLRAMREGNTLLDTPSPTPAAAAAILATLLALDAVVGVVGPLLQELASEEIPAAVTQLAQQREDARAQRQFEKADELRLAIEKAGYTVEDTPHGPRLRPARNFE